MYMELIVVYIFTISSTIIEAVIVKIYKNLYVHNWKKETIMIKPMLNF